ncbi:serine/threonine protein kinase [Lusitaniella coriacea LEGE 07157]|uniref:non-specific serine/threonine protein kinase n=1 Tax=Lusitaniella coriacea LEGE 07157 TaxID=945747 RepID=A0A8J7DVY9_9CYAN|nr:serine/threonine-protein kinase [Lusitaniella coriacea]MBE9116139.1 serine/threonine protein kinase [Lusitaniella coriacea LEGE 07157]
MTIGTLLDRRYQVVKGLGQGGFGRTYIAKDTRRPGNPTCVVKQLKPATSDPEFLQMARRLFNSEAETLEKVGKYDKIPRLLAYFEENEEFFLVQEYIAGHPLSAELKPGQRWSEGQVLKLLQEVLPILEFVHDNGVIHRDIKPDNLIRRATDRQLVLVDFGAVKQIQMPGIAATNDTVAIGTPGYMPSEQSQGRPRPSSDIYALGAIAVQALTGVNPTQLPENEDTGDLLWQDRAQVSDLFAAIISQMVRNYFAYRYQSATEVLQALEPLTQPLTPQALAIATRQMGRYYLSQGYRLALRALRPLSASRAVPTVKNADSSVPLPTSPEVSSHQNTVTIAPSRPSTAPRPPQYRPIDPLPPVPKLPLFLSLGTVALVAIAAVSTFRLPLSARFAAHHISADRQTKLQKDCTVVVKPSNVRVRAGGEKTGKVVAVGVQVAVTGKEERGWLEIRAPYSGWIWKQRTQNTCEAQPA